MNRELIRNKERVLLFVISAILLFSLFSDVPKNIIKDLINFRENKTLVSSENNTKKKVLEQTYNKLKQLEAVNDIEKIYDYLTPSEKSKMSLDSYIKYRKSLLPSTLVDYTIHGIEIYGDRGVVDSTTQRCFSEQCSGKDKLTQRLKREYYYINGRWYFNLENIVYCDRNQPYVIPQEFNRALSLIAQRLEESSSKILNTQAERNKLIKNCLDIQYATSEKILEGAEGVFIFDKNSPKDRLSIYVSPKYQIKDDLLTATLLSHEISHAFISALSGNEVISCYENEAIAFAVQSYFFDSLNQEEKNSIFERYYSSNEARNLIDTLDAINRYQDEYQKDRALKYAKSNPYYQKQCGLN